MRNQTKQPTVARVLTLLVIATLQVALGTPAFASDGGKKRSVKKKRKIHYYAVPNGRGGYAAVAGLNDKAVRELRAQAKPLGPRPTLSNRVNDARRTHAYRALKTGIPSWNKPSSRASSESSQPAKKTWAQRTGSFLGSIRNRITDAIKKRKIAKKKKSNAEILRLISEGKEAKRKEQEQERRQKSQQDLSQYKIQNSIRQSAHQEMKRRFTAAEKQDRAKIERISAMVSNWKKMDL